MSIKYFFDEIIFYYFFPAPSNNSQSRSEYRLPSAATQTSSNLVQRQSSSLPNKSSINQHPAHLKLKLPDYEPPPSYCATYGHQFAKQSEPLKLPQSTLNRQQSQVEQYRNPTFATGSDSDDDSQNLGLIRTYKSEVLLDNDPFCPDLIKTCKSITTIDYDDDEYERDYIDIDQLSIHNENVLPKFEKKINAMGQHVSLGRPKISLTWVLRDQQNQSYQKRIDWNGSKSREKLFNEKYVTNDSNRSTKLCEDEKKTNQNYRNETMPRVNEKIRRRLHETCCRQQQNPNDDGFDNLKIERKSLSQADLDLSSKNTYSEPSIYIASAASDSGALVKRHRRRRKKSPKQSFGYNIRNVDDFLSKCSLSSPANIPFVLSNSSILYQTRAGYSQVEIPLPLGMVVNSVFKNANWLYVTTPHLEEGYVKYNFCLPLGIIPNNR